MYLVNSNIYNIQVTPSRFNIEYLPCVTLLLRHSNDILWFYLKHMKYIVYKVECCQLFKISSLVKFSDFINFFQLFFVRDFNLNRRRGDYFVLFLSFLIGEIKIVTFEMVQSPRSHTFIQISLFVFNIFFTDFSSYRIMFKKLASKECIRSLSLSRSISTSMSRQSKFTTLSVDDKTGIATLEMNRPPVNSLNTLLLKDISNALDEVAKNRSKGLILTSVKTFYLFLVSLEIDLSVKLFNYIFSHQQQYFPLV